MNPGRIFGIVTTLASIIIFTEWAIKKDRSMVAALLRQLG